MAGPYLRSILAWGRGSGLRSGLAARAMRWFYKQVLPLISRRGGESAVEATLPRYTLLLRFSGLLGSLLGLFLQGVLISRLGLMASSSQLLGRGLVLSTRYSLLSRFFILGFQGEGRQGDFRCGDGRSMSCCTFFLPSGECCFNGLSRLTLNGNIPSTPQFLVRENCIYSCGLAYLSAIGLLCWSSGIRGWQVYLLGFSSLNILAFILKLNGLTLLLLSVFAFSGVKIGLRLRVRLLLLIVPDRLFSRVNSQTGGLLMIGAGENYCGGGIGLGYTFQGVNFLTSPSDAMLRLLMLSNIYFLQFYNLTLYYSIFSRDCYLTLLVLLGYSGLGLCPCLVVLSNVGFLSVICPASSFRNKADLTSYSKELISSLAGLWIQLFTKSRLFSTQLEYSLPILPSGLCVQLQANTSLSLPKLPSSTKLPLVNRTPSDFSLAFLCMPADTMRQSSSKTIAKPQSYPQRQQLWLTSLNLGLISVLSASCATIYADMNLISVFHSS